MTDQPTYEIGPMAERLAEVLADKVITALNEYPTPSPGERQALARTIADRITRYAETGM